MAWWGWDLAVVLGFIDMQLLENLEEGISWGEEEKSAWMG